MVELPSGQEKAQTAQTSLLGVYVHVPFCATTCDFCAFYQTVPKGDAVQRYLEGIEAEPGLRLVDAQGALLLRRYASFDHFA